MARTILRIDMIDAVKLKNWRCALYFILNSELFNMFSRSALTRPASILSDIFLHFGEKTSQ